MTEFGQHEDNLKGLHSQIESAQLILENLKAETIKLIEAITKSGKKYISEIHELRID